MIIVFFHVLYLFGKYIYKNYKPGINEADSENRASKSEEDNKATCRSPTQKPANVTPDDYFGDNYIDDSSSNIRFYPPAFIQRYVAVRNVLSDKKYEGQIRKVVDFGCSELGFFNHLKNTQGVQEILCVDVDRNTLRINKRKIEPLTSDYLHCRETPLRVKIFEGSITDQDEALENTDAVVCIEIIEHLYPQTLLDIPFNIFGFIKPKVAIMTTPNADFNVLFKGMRGFRHYDHKFEWTREQFEDWSNNIVVRYPDYEVTFQGIGSGPPGTEHLGECSQMAVFHRKEEPELFLQGIPGLFKIVACEDYPMVIDNRADDVKIMHEANYFIRQFTFNSQDEEMSLELLVSNLNKLNVSVETLRETLENSGMEVFDHEGKGLCVVLPDLSTFSTDEEEDMFEDDFAAEASNDEIQDEWENEPGPPVQWPEIHDQDEENWDIDTQDSQSAPREQSGIGFDDISSIISSRHSVISTDESDRELRGSSVDIHAEGIDFRHLESLDASMLPSDFDVASFEISTCLDDTSSSKNMSRPTPRFDTIGLDLPVSNDSLTECTRETSLISRKPMNSYEAECETSIELSASSSNNLDEKYAFNVSDGIPGECQCTRDLKSMCSMYLEPSTCETMQSCSGDISNPDFNCSELLDDSDIFHSANTSVRNHSEKCQSSCSKNQMPNQTSTPHQQDKNAGKKKRHRKKKSGCTVKSGDEGEIQADKNTSVAKNDETGACNNTPDNCTSCQRDKMEIIQKLNIHSKIASPDRNGSSSRISLLYLKSSTPKHFENSRTSINSANSSESSVENQSVLKVSESIPTDLKHVNWNQSGKEIPALIFAVGHSQEEICPESKKNIQSCGESDDIDKIKKKFDKSQEMMRDEASGENLRETEGKECSPDVRGSPPMSWSPEIMDSGYPNTSSAHDITPEYDLSSIAQDRISDPESPSVADPPRPDIQHVEHAVVENGDLANNNRDGEGNNMRAVEENELDDLQPLIQVLQHDLENENDIYDFRNGFPRWLLRIMDAEGALIQPEPDFNMQEHRGVGDADNLVRDEGFDSSSSETETEDIDENSDSYEIGNVSEV